MAWIILAVLAVVAIRAFSEPFVGLLGLLAITIVQPGELYPIIDAFHVERLIALIVLLSVMMKPEKLQFPPITKKVLMFWGAMFVAVPLAFWKSFALSNAFDFGRTIIYHVLLVNLVNSQKRVRAFVITYALLIGWLAGSTLFEYAHGQVQDKGTFTRAVGLTSSADDPNALGTTLVSGLPFVMLAISAGKKKMKLIGWCIAMAAVWTVVLTASRTSFLNLMFLLAFFSFTRKKWYVYLPIAVVLAASIWVVMPQQYKDRYMSVKDRDKDESYIHRVMAWKAGWAMFKDNPLTGVGAGVFPNANGSKYWPGKGHPVWLQPHSLYIQAIAELGAIGTVAFFAMVFATIRAARRLTATLAAGPKWLVGVPSACLFSLATLLFAGYSGHLLYRSNWYMLAALVAAMQLHIAPQLGKAEPVPAESELPAMVALA
jgi:O-antigen ligase